MSERNEQASGLSRQQIFQNIQSIKGTATLGVGGYLTFVDSERGIFCYLGRFMSLKSELQFCFCYERKANQVGLKKIEKTNGIKAYLFLFNFTNIWKISKCSTFSAD